MQAYNFSFCNSLLCPAGQPGNKCGEIRLGSDDVKCHLISNSFWCVMKLYICNAGAIVARHERIRRVLDNVFILVIFKQRIISNKVRWRSFVSAYLASNPGYTTCGGADKDHLAYTKREPWNTIWIPGTLYT